MSGRQRSKNLRRRAENDARIMAAWDEVADEFEDKSTEFCISITADRTNVDYGRVVDALSRHSQPSGNEHA